MNSIFRFYFLVLFSLVASSVFIVFAYSGEGPGARRGEGVSEISGWQIANVNYIPRGDDPTGISAVEFDLDSAASDVRIKLISGSANYFSCANLSGTHWYCDVSGVGIASMDELRVIALNQ